VIQTDPPNSPPLDGELVIGGSALALVRNVCNISM
jgi:hypothetical protein